MARYRHSKPKCEYCGREFETMEDLKEHDYKSIKAEGKCKDIR